MSIFACMMQLGGINTDCVVIEIFYGQMTKRDGGKGWKKKYTLVGPPGWHMMLGK